MGEDLRVHSCDRLPGEQAHGLDVSVFAPEETASSLPPSAAATMLGLDCLSSGARRMILETQLKLKAQP